MGFKFGSRLDPKATSAKESEDPVALEDTPLNRLRSGLRLQPGHASAQSAPANEPQSVAAPPMPEPAPLIETKAVEAKPAEAKPAEAKPVEAKRAEVAPMDANPAGMKPAEVKPI